jgi:hypothetical protein
MSACAGARAASSSLRFLSAVLFLFAAAAPAGAVEPIFVPMDQARILKIPDRTATLVIGNPLIADVTVERQTYSCTPECSALVALGDTGKDYFDKDTFQELDPFKKTIEQTTTRNAQAAAAGAGR